MAANARAAAERLGLTQSAVHEMIRSGRLVASGRPFLVDDASIERVAAERRLEALRRVRDETGLARKVAAILDPKPVIITRANGNADADSIAASMGLPRGRNALHLLPSDAWPLWGPTTLKSAAVRADWNTGKRGCLTCWTRCAASVHQTLAPRGDVASRLLLGGGCDTCQAAFAAEKRDATRQMRALSASVRADRDRDRLRQFDAQQRAAMAEVKQASANFARLVEQRKQAGLPPLGGRR